MFRVLGMVFCALICVILSISAVAQPAPTPSGGLQTTQDLPRHIIFLTDDSGDMNLERFEVGSQLSKMASEVIYDPKYGIEFEPAKDKISIGFYGLKALGRDWEDSSSKQIEFLQSATRRYSNALTPEGMIVWPNTLFDGDKAAFRARMNVLYRAHRGGSANWSPISIAQSLAVESIADELAAQKDVPKFGEIILLNLSNYVQNASDPSAAVKYYLDKGAIQENITQQQMRTGYYVSRPQRDPSKTAQRLDLINSDFKLRARISEQYCISVTNTYSNVIFDVNNRSFARCRRQSDNNAPFLKVVSVQPDSSISDFQLEIAGENTLERLAVSPKKVKLVSPDEGNALILRNNGRWEGVEYNLVPKSFGDVEALSFLSEPSEPITGGVEGCAAKDAGDEVLVNCRSISNDEQQSYTIDYISALGLNQEIAADTDIQTLGNVQANALFKFQSDIYGYLYQYSDMRSSAISEAKPEIVKSNLLPDVEIDSLKLASLWKSKDVDGLNIREARSRIERKQTIWSLLYLAAGILFLYCLYLFWPTRRFRPSLKWSPSQEVNLDFNNIGTAPVIVGTVNFINKGIAGPITRLLGKDAHPNVKAALELSSPDFASEDISTRGQGTAQIVGFINENTDNIVSSRSSVITHDSNEFLYVPANIIADLLLADKGKAVKLAKTVDCKLNVQWEEKKLWNLPFLKSKKTYDENLKVDLNLIPRKPEAPYVSFLPAEASRELDYDLGSGEDRKLKVIGHMVFEGKENSLKFGEAFSGTFSLVSRVNGDPVPDAYIGFINGPKTHTSPLVSTISPVIESGKTTKIPVFVSLSRDIEHGVLNPLPGGAEIVVELRGPLQPESNSEGVVRLNRDATPPECLLGLLYQPHKGELGTLMLDWGKLADNAPSFVWRPSFGGEGTTEIVKRGTNSVINFEPKNLELEYNETIRASEVANILSMELGNVAKNGDGYMSGTISATLLIGDAYAYGLVPRDQSLDQAQFNKTFVEIWQNGKVLDSGAFKLDEGDTNLRLDFKPKSWAVERMLQSLDDGIIPADQAQLHIVVKTKLVPDKGLTDEFGKQQSRKVELVLPLKISRAVSSNVLLIDFGTSAIAAGVQQPKQDYASIDFQNITQVNVFGKLSTLAKMDKQNSESGTPFLPSVIDFSGDLRLEKDNKIRRGFSGAKGDLKLGEAGFVSLPTDSNNFFDKHYSQRIVIALKSWFSSGLPNVEISDEVEFTDEEGVTRTDDRVPLKGAVKSAFSALYNAYLSQEIDYDIGKIIVTRPNTLTDFKVREFENIVFDSLGDKFNLQLRHQVRSISESDAVAYSYIWNKLENADTLEEESFPEKETILVYDLGAGTTDLSLVEIRWGKDRNSIESMRILSRVGVGLAGNHIDKLIAMGVHYELEKLIAGKTKADQFSGLRYPIVAKDVVKQDEKFRLIMTDLWRKIRSGKIEFIRQLSLGRQSDFSIDVGKTAEGGESFIRFEDNVKFPTYKPDGKNAIVTNTEGKALEKRRMLTLSRTLFDNPAFHDFTNFLTQDLIDECFAAGGVETADIDSVILAGRGALWPGVRDKLQDRFTVERLKSPMGDLKYLQNPVALKEAVVKGAFALDYMIQRGLDLSFDPADLVLDLAIVGRSTSDDDKVLDVWPESRWGEKLVPKLQGRYELIQTYVKDLKPDDFKGYRNKLHISIPINTGNLEAGVPVSFKKSQTDKGELLIEVIQYGAVPKTFQWAVDPRAINAESLRPDWPIGAAQISQSEYETYFKPKD